MAFTLTLIDYNVSKLLAFFKANGQEEDDQVFKYSKRKRAEEDFKGCLLTAVQTQALIKHEWIAWSELHGKKIYLDDEEFENHWPNRLSFGGKPAVSWQEAIRKKGAFHLMLCIL